MTLLNGAAAHINSAMKVAENTEILLQLQVGGRSAEKVVSGGGRWW